MTFPLQPSHPALEGVEPDDLKFWRGDHMVSDHELPRPARGAASAIVVSGSQTGISYAPLLERPMGRGCIVHSQLRLVAKSAEEPSAAILLGNLIEYLADQRAAARKTAVFGGDATYHGALRDLGLRFDVLDTSADGGVKLERYSLVIVHGDVGDAALPPQAWRRFVESGGNVVVHRPSDGTMKRVVADGLGLPVILQGGQGSVTRAERGHPLLEAITREDLYWTVKRPGLSWARQPLSRDMLDGVFGTAFDPAGARRVEIEPWQLDGQYVTAGSMSVTFATAGRASGEIEVPERAVYAIGLRARGTPCRGVYPVAEISLDDEPWGRVQLDRGQWAVYSASGVIDKGRHRLTIAFVNDASNPPSEDRNLEVDHLLIKRDREAEQLAFLTAPGAVAAAQFGRGTVVLDAIRWDTETDNGQKAARYACSLLTALGGDFTPRPAVTIQCEEMSPKPEMNHFNRSGGVAYMGCNGYIKTTLRVAESKSYAVDLLASGDASDGVCPLVEIKLNGEKLGEVQLTTEGWRTYSLTLDLPKGDHEFSLEFVNDHSSPTGDRNLRLDKVVFYNE